MLDDDSKLSKQYPGNTDKQKKEPTEQKNTIRGNLAKSVKSIDLGKLFESLIYDWIFPGMEAAGDEILRMIFNPDRRGSGNGGSAGKGKGARHTEYNSMYNGERGSSVIYDPVRAPEIVFDRREEAEQALSGITQYLDDYPRITLKEFYNIVEEVSKGRIRVSRNGYTLTKYGWSSTDGVRISKVRDGWILSMPKSEVFEQ